VAAGRAGGGLGRSFRAEGGDAHYVLGKNRRIPRGGVSTWKSSLAFCCAAEAAWKPVKNRLGILQGGTPGGPNVRKRGQKDFEGLGNCVGSPRVLADGEKFRDR